MREVQLGWDANQWIHDSCCMVFSERITSHILSLITELSSLIHSLISLILWWTNIEIENGHLQWIYPFKIVIFHGYVNIYQRVIIITSPDLCWLDYHSGFLAAEFCMDPQDKVREILVLRRDAAQLMDGKCEVSRPTASSWWIEKFLTHTVLF